MRKGFEPYKPPHRRRLDTEQTYNVPRSLDDLAATTTVLHVLHAAKETVPDLTTCPFKASVESPGRLKVTVWRCLLDEERNEFLEWCISQKCCLEDFEVHFPSDLTKAERASWHRAAQDLGLFSQSKGIGDGRSLMVCSNQAKVNSQSAMQRLSDAQQKEVDRIYACCEKEGRSAWEISKTEILEMLTVPNGITEEIQRSLEKHSKPNSSTIREL